MRSHCLWKCLDINTDECSNFMSWGDGNFLSFCFGRFSYIEATFDHPFWLTEFSLIYVDVNWCSAKPLKTSFPDQIRRCLSKSVQRRLVYIERVVNRSITPKA